ncbi:hypothetical protein [Burkholderia gladioli]|uniref:hypothetical protein n=1 Tax=Burkholderia gladioli TaxID=28095 RepID=UPI0016421889|nr:hypothetical protein [Burkholderia gladioli]MBU9384047.1 hypothetical protein [Burkholderia gladioli]MDC6129095.1 hypothetical protein [Burkholderia gladioli]
MNHFAAKRFRGQQYTLEHLQPMILQVPLSPAGKPPISVSIVVRFGCHCFTVSFRDDIHGDEHRYTHPGELRAFDETRYWCSRQLPTVIAGMLGGMIYWSRESYTYVAQVVLPMADGPRDYSLFFSLTKNHASLLPALNMYVKSAYLRNLAASTGAQRWRFRSLVGLVAGVYQEQENARPKKKKAPKGLSQAR